mgnify:CR=1 FL=1
MNVVNTITQYLLFITKISRKFISLPEQLTVNWIAGCNEFNKFGIKALSIYEEFNMIKQSSKYRLKLVIIYS